MQHHEFDIKFYTSDQLNRTAWNDCISNSSQRLIYAFDWYLDCVTQKKWGAFVCEIAQKYVAVLPVALGKKWGISYTYQPFFTQQLGVFGTNEAAQNWLLSQAPQLLRRKFWLVQYCFNQKNEVVGKEFTRIEECVTYQIDLNESYETLRAVYNQNRRRDLRKAERLEVRESIDIESVIEIFINEKGKQIEDVTWREYAMLASLFRQAHERGQAILLVAQNPKQEVLAGAVFWIDKPYVTLIFSGASAMAKNTGAITKIIDTALQRFANKPHIFDFEGSMIPSLAHFYQTFGGKSSIYRLFKYKIWNF
ncbi:hypothetical protein SAMN05421780_10372 [Flexibacter flexilis DSM 6793]|uniref:Acetyltransferase (GNAT) domain-containing protein n=1 Tax=Flexibacter flexilis DSM 6793 TaxID=927664 RepID=A0A1I1GSZ5_9BACT|nr:hypothetical protein [Flexibacter flexilis]SFC14422.1 hypothetical protein SAMN05421780_10372 [Flexibacter flexilis DSM 6793]